MKKLFLIIVVLILVVTSFILGRMTFQYKSELTEEKNDIVTKEDSKEEPKAAQPKEEQPTVVAEKDDLIRVFAPDSETPLTSPLTIRGEARGSWYFEATFQVVLTNWDGLIIAEGYATAQGDWMTENYVPFTATLKFATPDVSVSNKGSLILQASNPSGLPANDKALEIPIIFSDKK